ncbi:MAG: hypothetical protein GY909_08815 [Oligoflexia bacterium]|nr:hypothetical protein [Oligoflexia bacterium]
MKKLNALTLTFILTFTLSCETDQDATQGALGEMIAAERNPDAAEAMITLTNGGTNFPDGRSLSRVVSNPGNIDRDCNHNTSRRPASPQPQPSFSGNTRFTSNNTGRSQNTYGYSLKRHPIPRKGCIPPDTISLDEAKQAIASQNLTYRAARGSKAVSNAEVKALGAAVMSVQHLAGGVFRPGSPRSGQPSPFPVEFSDSSGSQQYWEKIKVGRSGHMHYGSSVAQHVHEWSHLIGNNLMPGTNTSVYDAFYRHLGGTRGDFRKQGQARGKIKPCLVSGYSDNKANEHFAELFTAFVTQPSILKNNNFGDKETCRKSFEFFEKILFKNGSKVKECM